MHMHMVAVVPVSTYTYDTNTIILLAQHYGMNGIAQHYDMTGTNPGIIDANTVTINITAWYCCQHYGMIVVLLVSTG